jgi:single-stranded-DNA-specific exonuclease
MEARWTLQEPQTPPEDLEHALGVTRATARILSARGFDTESASRFLETDIEGLRDPFELEGVREAVSVLESAIDRKTNVFIHGDYDVDGITGAALLYRNLKRLQARVMEPYVPDRFQEGYGLSMSGVEEAGRRGAGVLLSVDCGVTAHREIARAREMGMDAVVLDHHEHTGERPDARALVDPKVSGYPHGELTGVGVAFKVMDGLHRTLGRDRKPLLWDLDLVALGTVADVAPLLGENRILVKYGMRVLGSTLKAGLRALRREAGISDEVSTQEISFGFAPRLNAAGRISHARAALDLLLTQDGERACDIARTLCEENKKRQEIEAEILMEALNELERWDLNKHWGLVLAGEGWHEGVIGIVASRIVDRFHRPVVLLSVSGDRAKGSGRSIPQFDLYGALSRCGEMFESFGGHRAAAGLRMATGKIDDFRERFDEIAQEELNEEDLRPRFRVDTRAEIGELSESFFEEYERLGPFGEGNPEPVMILEDMEVVGEPKVMKDEHLKFTVRKGNDFRSVFGPRLGSWIDDLQPGSTHLDVLFKLGRDTWSRRERYQLNALDLRRRERDG